MILCATACRARQQAKGIALRIEGEPAAVSGQRRTLEQMIFNLTDNAINYNKPQGSVTLVTGTENGRPFVPGGGYRHRYRTGGPAARV